MTEGMTMELKRSYYAQAYIGEFLRLMRLGRLEHMKVRNHD
jgi:hypothetical protein